MDAKQKCGSCAIAIPFLRVGAREPGTIFAYVCNQSISHTHEFLYKGILFLA